MDERPREGLRCIVGAIVCDHTHWVNTAVLLFFLLSPAKFLMGRRYGLLPDLLFVFGLC